MFSLFPAAASDNLLATVSEKSKKDPVHSAFTITFLAAQTSTWEKLKKIPSESWINLGLFILAVVLVVRLWRTMRRINEFVPWIASVVASAMILSYWTYNRTEPRFLTPVVEKLTVFLPTKSKHEQDLEKLRKSREDRP